MNIVHGYPPNIDALDAAFGVRGQPRVIFTYGDTIYVPGGGPLSRELMAHEAVHGQRQGALQPTIDAWWDRYIVDVEFRLAEELVAHAAEYREFCRHVADRNKRIGFLMTTVAARLAGPLYGNLLTPGQARRAIEAMR